MPQRCAKILFVRRVRRTQSTTQAASVAQTREHTIVLRLKYRAVIMSLRPSLRLSMLCVCVHFAGELKETKPSPKPEKPKEVQRRQPRINRHVRVSRNVMQLASTFPQSHASCSAHILASICGRDSCLGTDRSDHLAAQ